MLFSPVGLLPCTTRRPYLAKPVCPRAWPPAARPQVDAEKRTLIKQLPHTLVLHLKRFEWDYETYQRWKVGLGLSATAGVWLL